MGPWTVNYGIYIGVHGFITVKATSGYEVLTCDNIVLFAGMVHINIYIYILKLEQIGFLHICRIPLLMRLWFS